jgi:glycosyltransferase involved in cell wall biosynthesis
VKVAFLVVDVGGTGGTERSVITQAGALHAAGVEVAIVSLVRNVERPHFAIDPGIRVHYLIDRTSGRPAPVEAPTLVDDDEAARLDRLPSLLVPHRWDVQFTALMDVAAEQWLPHLAADVLVTVTPPLLAVGAQLAPAGVVLVHQEHRSTPQRVAAMEPLLTFAPRADVVALLTDGVRDWFLEAVGDAAPTTVVVPNPLPPGFKPRSTLDSGLIVGAGRLVPEKQFHKLVAAFAEIADRIPDWRLRILGAGPQRADLVRLTRKLGLYDRVELAGQSADMGSEWAMAAVAALTSRYEGLPLVAQEAMAAGVPVAAFDTPSGARALVEHDVNGLLVAPDSVPGMARALLDLATDDVLRRRLGAEALRSSRRYDAGGIAREWIAIFDAAIERHRRRPGRLLRRAGEMPDPDGAMAESPTVHDVTPAEARARALTWAARSAERSSGRWFVIPPGRNEPVTLVVPMTDRAAFLTELSGPGAPELLSLVDTAGHGWLPRRGSIEDLAEVLKRSRTSRITLQPWPRSESDPGVLSQGCDVDVQFWEEAANGSLVAPVLNRFTATVPPGAALVDAEIHGVRVPTLPLMAEPTVFDCAFPIDAVYTWVDGNDPAWRKARELRLAQETGAPLQAGAVGRARFESRDELRFSLRSLELFAPWVRTIHLVTAGQVPAWLGEHPRIRVVDHREILPPEALPTFNSHAIETGLHHLPDLSEHFIYLNDDVMLGRPLDPQMFFTPAGQTSVFLSINALGLDDPADVPPWRGAGLHNRRILRESFGVIPTYTLAHTPHPHRRSVLEEIEQRFPEEVGRTACRPFRSADDISLLSSFAQHYGLITGSAVLGSGSAAFVNITSNDVARRLRRLTARQHDFICLGDHHEHSHEPAVLARLLTDFLESYFPVPGPWEASS